MQEMSSECTDEAGKVLKHSSDNPFIEPQQQTVVDMKGMSFFLTIFIWIQYIFLFFFRRDGFKRYY